MYPEFLIVLDFMKRSLTDFSIVQALRAEYREARAKAASRMAAEGGEQSSVTQQFLSAIESSTGGKKRCRYSRLEV